MAEPLDNGRFFDIGTAALRYQEAFGRWPTRLELWNFTRGGEDHGGAPGLNADITAPDGTVYTSPNEFLADIETSEGSFNFEQVAGVDIDESATLSDAEIAFGENNAWLVSLLEIPEIRGIVRRAVDGNWSPQRIQSAIAGSQWGQNHSARERELEILRRTDPATYDQERAQIEDRVGQVFLTLTGDRASTLSPSALDEIVQEAWINGWDETRISRALVPMLDVGTEVSQGAGAIASGAAQISEWADEYGVSISTGELNRLTSQLTEGTSNELLIRQRFADQSRRMYPAFADQISADTSVRSLVDPYLQTAEQELGIPSSQMSLTDSRWRRVMTDRDADGNPLSLDDWVTTLRTDGEYRWNETRQGQELLATRRNQLRGRVGLR